jgi:hypothetical protein
VAGDDVIVNGGFTVTVDVANAACLSLQLGGTTLGTGAGTLAFSSGSKLAVSGLVRLGVTNNTPGNLTMAAGGTLACEGFVDTRLGTWTPGTGTIEFTATNTIPTNNLIDFNNLAVSGGTTTVSRNMTVAGNVVIGAGGTLVCGANVVTCNGDWTNDGTFTGSTGTIIFGRNGNQTIGGSGANNFNLVRVNLGASVANTLEVTAAQFSAPNAFLTLTNGTFKVSGTFPYAGTFLAGPAYNIPVGTGLWINNPNVTVTAQAGSASLRGLLRLSAGTYNVGTTTDESLVYQATGSSLIVEGGTLNVAGRFCGSNATAATSYTQTGGTVGVAQHGSTDPVFAGFDLSAAGSTFTMSGGTLIVSNATSAPADFVNLSAVATVTGGTLQIGDALTGNAQTIRIQSPRPIGNLVVSNATAQGVKPTARLVSSSLNVAGGVTVQSGTSLDANGLNVTLGGDWTDSGTYLGGNTVTFNGAGAQSMPGSAGETFNNLVVNKSAGALALNGSVAVNGTASLTLGAIAVGTNTLTLNGAVSGAATLGSSSSGTVRYNQGSPGQNVLAGSYGNLEFSGFSKVLAPPGAIGISGTFTPGGAVSHTTAGSTIDFNGATQAVPAFPYNNLTLSGPGAKTGSGVITVAGNLSNGAGVAFSGATTLALNGTTHANAGTLGAATLSLGAGATLTNSGAISVSTALAGAGTLTQAATGSLSLGGTAGIATLNASAAGNTVNYTGASQAVAPATYHHLTLSGSGAPVLAGVGTINGDFTLAGTVAPVAANGITVGGNWTIGSGTSFDAGAFAHVVKGNWSGPGTFIAGTSSVSFAGTTAQSLGAGTFYDLAIANASGVTLLAGTTVGHTLTLTTGTLGIGANTLTLGGAVSVGAGSLTGGASSSVVVNGAGASTALPGITLANFTLNRAAGASLLGDLTVGGTATIASGTLGTGGNALVLSAGAGLVEAAGSPVLGTVSTTRNVTATSGTEAFGNIGADLVLNGVAPGTTTVVRRTGASSTGAGHTSIARNFDITPATNSGLNAGLVLHYDATELGAQSASALELYRSRDGGVSWNDLGGVVNTATRTITVSGLNDFSRWTAADTSNRIGPTALPTLASLTPAAKIAGSPAFTLTVTGTEFVAGKSVVRFNGLDRPTTYAGSTQLTAAIPASDLLVAGPVPVTVFNAGGGASGAQTFTVTPLTASTVRVETAANGSGTVVPAQSLASGTPVTLFAITRDALNNFVANVAATAWTVENITGGVVAGDLVPAVDGKSAVFTAHVVGTANVRATSAALTATPGGVLTVTSGSAAGVRVETAANGSGTLVPAQSLPSGTSLTAFAITRDASNNFVANVAATAWSLQGATGGVVAGDLVPAVDGKSATFTAHVSGSASLRATSGALAPTGSGTITVTAGTATKVGVETAANGTGVTLPAQTIASGNSAAGFAVARDASNNFVANVVATWSLQGVTGGVAAGDLVPAVDGKSAVFTGHVAGSASLRAVSGALAATNSGVLTVASGTAAAVRVETAADGTGTLVPAQALPSGSALSLFAITRDAAGNFVANAAATAWSVQGATGGVSGTDLVPAPDGKSAVFTAHATGTATVRATSGALAATSTGLLSVSAGNAAKIAPETAADGSGTVFPALALGSGGAITVFAITRDAAGNFVANAAAGTWSLAGVTGAVVAGDLVAAADGRSAVFTGHGTGSTAIRATSGTLAVTNSGTITVTLGSPARVTVETAANGAGSLVPAQSLPSGSSLTAFAISRDGAGNFIANVAATAWSLQGVTGGVAAGDLVPAADGRSAVFTAHLAGKASVRATSGALTPTDSGLLTVTGGTATEIRVETAADGTGTVVPAQLLAQGDSLRVFAITRDALGNFVANTAASGWSILNVTGGIVPGDLVPAADSRSALFRVHAPGTANVQATSGALATVPSGTITATAASGVGDAAAPAAFALGQNFPNPFRQETTLRYSIPKPGRVSVQIFDVTGREVATLADGEQPAGEHVIRWDPGTLRSGTYFYSLRSDGRQQVRKMLLTR